MWLIYDFFLFSGYYKMKVIEYLMVTLVTFLILQGVYGHPQPLASNNSMISKPNADKKLDNQETESQKKEESNHETKDSIDKGD